jgi:urocanate hydratase
MTERTEDAQLQALRAFLLLCSLGGDWPGKLVLVRSLGPEGRAFSVAATIAGAACLVVESRAEVCRTAFRAGACDFVVNSVDEALRILKNEVRKRKPVSVAVAMPETAAIEELAARGVVPAVFLTGPGGEQDGRFAELGARLIEPGERDALVAEYATRHGLAAREFGFSSAAELAEFDRRLARVIPEGDPRRQWVASASRFFYRERPLRRVAYLTADEKARRRR